MSKWGRLAAAGALGVDACCVALYCAHPRFYGDAPLGSKRWRARLDPRRSLFDAVVGLAFLRVAFYAVCVGATPGGAALGRRALLRCHAVLAVLVSAALARVAYQRLAGDLDRVHRDVRRVERDPDLHRTVRRKLTHQGIPFRGAGAGRAAALV